MTDLLNRTLDDAGVTSDVIRSVPLRTTEHPTLKLTLEDDAPGGDRRTIAALLTSPRERLSMLRLLQG